MARVYSCPRCNSDIDITSVVAHYGNKGILPPKQGIRCRQCREVLDIVQYQAILFTLLLMLVLVSLLGIFLKWIHTTRAAEIVGQGPLDGALLVVFLAGAIFLIFRFYDHFIKLRLAGVDGGIRSDDEIWRDPRRVDQDLAQFEAQELKIRGQDVETGIRHRAADWRCSGCGETNGKELQMCWNCGVVPQPD